MTEHKRRPHSSVRGIRYVVLVVARLIISLLSEAGGCVTMRVFNFYSPHTRQTSLSATNGERCTSAVGRGVGRGRVVGLSSAICTGRD